MITVTALNGGSFIGRTNLDCTVDYAVKEFESAGYRTAFECDERTIMVADDNQHSYVIESVEEESNDSNSKRHS